MLNRSPENHFEDVEANQFLDQFIYYIKNHYEADKKLAEKSGMAELIVFLTQVKEKALSHKLAYKAKYGIEAYRKITFHVNGKDKTIKQLVTDDFEQARVGFGALPSAHEEKPLTEGEAPIIANSLVKPTIANVSTPTAPSTSIKTQAPDQPASGSSAPIAQKNNEKKKSQTSKKSMAPLVGFFARKGGSNLQFDLLFDVDLTSPKRKQNTDNNSSSSHCFPFCVIC